MWGEIRDLRCGVFNRTHHVRARRAAIGKLIAEGILKPAMDDPRFYRPIQPSLRDAEAARDRRRGQPDQERQLTLEFEVHDLDAS
jgi:hypothetical protein